MKHTFAIFPVLFITFVVAQIYAQSPFIVPSSGNLNASYKSIPGACTNSPAPLKNGNGSLGSTYNNSACGLNYVYASRMITKRFDSYTTTGTYGCGLPCPNYTISGLPSCAVIDQAYVWFIASYDNYSNVNVSVTNPLGTTSSFPAAVIGTGGDKCWGENGTIVGRASVTGAISGNGNYTINITGITYSSSNVDGIDGATLIIIYRDPLATYQGSFIVYDGNVTGIGTSYNQNIGGFNACAASSLARAFLIVSDMQDNVNGAQHPSTVNGATANYPNNFWCFDATNTTVNAGQTTASYGVDGLGSDCWTLGVAALYYQTTTCTTCTPSPPVPLSVNTSSTNATCGQNNGTATVTSVTGGTSPYTYQWSTLPQQTTSTATGLAPGQYDVIVQDASGCSRDTTTIAVSTTSGLAITTSNSNVLCSGGATGSATVNATGGVPPYSYAWSGGQSISTVTGLSLGTYTVSVSDTSTACQLTASVTITEPAAFSVSILLSTDATCSGVNDGSISANASGGVSPYTFQWDASTGNQISATATGLMAGTYFLTTTDANGCTSTASSTITMPGAITVTATKLDVTCYGYSNGTATVDATGGVSPYTYQWSNSQVTQSITGLPAGIYTVTVTGNDCSPSGIELVTNGNFSAGNSGFSSGYSYCNSSGCLGPEGTYAVGSNPNFFHGAFYGNDHTTGSGNLMIINGSGTPGTSVWCQTISVTPNTTYLFSTWVATMVVGSPAQLQFSINGVPIGNIFSAPNSQYVWMQFFEKWNSGGNTSATICIVNQNTTLGGNDFGIDDISFQQCVGACLDIATVTVAQPALLSLSYATAAVSCYGYNDGSAMVAGSGGTPFYSYLWDGAAGNQATSTATGLVAGTYSVTLSDANNCTATGSATVTQPALLTGVITSSANVSCFGGNNGSATVSAGGGITPYSYLWNDANFQTMSTATGLPAGTYIVAVADVNICMATDTIVITEPPLLVSQIVQINHVSCYGGWDGNASVSVSGGITAYSYFWNSSPAQFSDSAAGLPAGVYTLMVTDANGCTTTSTATVTEPALLTAAVTYKDNVSCYGFNDGMAVVSAGGGIQPWSYVWSDPSAQTNDTAQNLLAGSYVVQVTDANGCIAFANAQITQPTILFPFITGSTDVSCYGFSDGTANASATGGTPPYQFAWNDPGSQVNANATGLPADTFTVTITDFNGCIDSSAVIINQPILLVTVITSVTDVTCNSISNGTVTVSASGGTPSYTYLWNDPGNQNTPSAVGLGPGQFIVTVTDANNCVTYDTASITEPPPLVPVITSDVTICTNGSASIGVTVTGGIPPYTYTWDNSLPGIPSHSVNPVSTTTYTVIIRDSNQCTAPAQDVTVTVLPPLSVWIPQAADLCNGNSTTIVASVSGGNGNYTYIWNQGIGNAGSAITVTPLTTTTYSVTVSDGCETTPETAQITVTVNELPFVQFLDAAAGCAPLIADFIDQSTVTGGTITQWSWDFGDYYGTSTGTTSAQESHTYPSPGTYDVSLTVTSDKGCTQSITKPALVVVFPLPLADFTSYPQKTTILAPNVSFTDLSSVSPGTIAGREWDFGDHTTATGYNPSHTYTDTGHYDVCLMVTTDRSCKDTVCKLVVVLGEFALFTPNSFTPNGDGINEFFMPKHIGVNENAYEFMIVDRWGDVIFRTNDVNTGWDGSANNGNDMAQQDVYIWVVNTRDINSDKHRFIGHVTLVK